MGANPWVCPHDVPAGQYCRYCDRATRRTPAAIFWTLALRALLAALPDRHVECPDERGGAR